MQGEAHIKVEIQPNSEFQSLTLSPTRSPGPPQLQIDVQDAYQIGFQHSTYARKEDEINFAMAVVPGPTKIGLDPNAETISIYRVQLIQELSILKLIPRSHMTYNSVILRLHGKTRR
jgi:hypothetical protein